MKKQKLACTVFDESGAVETSITRNVETHWNPRECGWILNAHFSTDFKGIYVLHIMGQSMHEVYHLLVNGKDPQQSLFPPPILFLVFYIGYDRTMLIVDRRIICFYFKILFLLNLRT